MKHLKKFNYHRFNENKEKENFFINPEAEIWNIFNKAETGTPDVISEENLVKSLEMIGDGEIKKHANGYTYKEFLDDNKLFIVHGRIGRPLFTRGYSYEIKVLKNSPSTSQVGGGYGTSGLDITTYPKILHYDTGQKVYSRIDTVSKVCNEIKEML